MTNRLFTICAMGFLALGTISEAAVTEFSYANGELSGYGKSKKEVVDVAMCINDPSLAGMKVTSVKAYINTTEGISNTSIWLSNNLTLENKVNVADIGSYEVKPVAANIQGMNLGLLEVTLPQAYTLTESPLYIGYSLTVDDNTTEGMKQPIIIADNINPNGLYVHLSKSVLKWMDYSATAGGVAYIVATLEGDVPSYSLGIQGYNTIYAEDNKAYEGTFNVTNKGSNAIENIKYVYSVDGGVQKEGQLALPSAIVPNIAVSFPITLNFDGVSGAGSHSLELNITELNGEANKAVNSSISCVVNVIPFIPVHRPLVEEYTGLWCGWCPRGFLAMEMIAEDYGNNEVSICYHNGDPMQVTANYPMNVSGFPSASIDRQSLIDPYYGSNDKEFGISFDLMDAMAVLSEAVIEVEAHLSGETVEVESSVRFIRDFQDANFEVGYVLICNGLTDPTWAQSNYYAGQSGYAGTPLEVLTTWQSKELGLIFNDVAVDVSAMNGVAGSVPSSITTGTEYGNSYSFDIKDNVLVQDKNNIVVAAYVIDKSTNKIVNANKCKINTSGIENIQSVGNVIEREYYDLTGRKLQNPSKGIIIVKERLSNGEVRTSKIMKLN